jgi:hypothetical protein
MNNRVNMNLPAFLTILFASYEGRSSMTALQAKVDNSDSDSGSFKLFVRFSNLIGGPTFLPIHAEIMLWDCEREIEEIENVERNPGRTGGEMNFLHRIDFIPLKPTEPSTICGCFLFRMWKV